MTRRVVLERTVRLDLPAHPFETAAEVLRWAERYGHGHSPDAVSPWRIVSAEPPFPDHPEDQK